MSSKKTVAKSDVKCAVCGGLIDSGQEIQVVVGSSSGCRGRVEKLIVVHAASTGMSCVKRTAKLTMGDRNPLSWRVFEGDILSVVKSVYEMTPISQDVRREIKKLRKLADVKVSNIFRSLGMHVREIRETVMKSPRDGEYQCYVLQREGDTSHVEVVNKPITLDLPGLSAVGSDGRKIFQTPGDAYLVGYDIETQDISTELQKEMSADGVRRSKIVSHQWWFNLAGVRFGVVFITDLRISQRQFVDFLAAVVPVPVDVKKGDSKRKIFVWSYFSIYESGWMHQSGKIPTTNQKRPVKVPKKNATAEQWKKFYTEVRFVYDKLIQERSEELKWSESEVINELVEGILVGNWPNPRERDLILERDKEWCGVTSIHGGLSSLRFEDAKNLRTGGLAGLGKAIGIHKLEHDQIDQMESYSKTDLDNFTRYGIIDCVIAAEAQLYFKYMTRVIVSRATGGKVVVDEMKTRITSFSSAIFQAIFKNLFGDDWKLYFGYEEQARKSVQRYGVATKTVVRPTLVHELFVKHYYGGRNDVFEVGPRGPAYYHDLHSAYLSAVAMMADYDFSKAMVWDSRTANRRVEELLTVGPCMPHGITVSFCFKDDAKPIFPVRINDPSLMPGLKSFTTDGLLYPRSGTSSISWPEYWVAKKHNLLENEIIHELVEFDPMRDGDGNPTQKFSEVIRELLRQRAQSEDSAVKDYLKAVLNYLYGLTGQGISDAVDAIRTHDDKKFAYAKLSCYPLAAYITGFTRAVVGELLNRNPCYAITTDGFISPKCEDELDRGELCRMVDATLNLVDKDGKPKSFVSAKAEESGNKSFFTKTRGYITLQETTQADGTKSVEVRKIAAQGAQARDENTRTYTTASIKKLLDQFAAGYGDKSYWPSLSEVRKRQKTDKDFTPCPLVRELSKVDMTYDFKHLPDGEIVEVEFEYGGEAYKYKGKPFKFVSFKTIPIDSAMDFHALRMLAGRREKNREFIENIGKYKEEAERAGGYNKVLECMEEDKSIAPYMKKRDYDDLLAVFRKYSRAYLGDPKKEKS